MNNSLNEFEFQEKHFTLNPEIDPFKYKYYRHIPFQTTLKHLNFNDTQDFGKRVACDVPFNYGHLLSKIYLYIKLPKLQPESGSYLCWSDDIGNTIIDGTIDLEFNGITVQTVYPECEAMISEVILEKGNEIVTGKSGLYSAIRYNAAEELELVMPLKFFFTKGYQNALPVYLMNNQGLKVSLKFKEFNQVINYNGDPPVAKPEIIETYLLAEYVTLPDYRLIREVTTRIIELTNVNSFDVEQASGSILTFDLSFHSPVKYIVFGCVSSAAITNNDYYNYSNLINSISLSLNGIYKFTEIPEVYFRLTVPYELFNKVPLKYLYFIPFSINPQNDIQPAGNLNMSPIDSVKLILKMKPGYTDFKLNVYSRYYNVLNIENGFAELMWI